MKIEANLLPRREPIATNQVVDWFSTLEEIKTAKKRLYNPRLRTPEALKIWNKLPNFLEENKDLLYLCMGSKDVSVHLHGSMLLGMGTDGRNEHNGGHFEKIYPSDVDLLIFVGEKDDNEQKYQAKSGQIDKDLPGVLKEGERGYRFLEESNFLTKLDRRGETMIVRMPELKGQIKEFCTKLLNGQRPSEKELIYNTSMLFGSDSLFQGNQNTEAKWRNEILKTLLESPSGEIVWTEGIKKDFSKYLVGYRENAFSSTAAGWHKKRVDLAFEEILSERNVPQKYRGQAKDALNKQRAKIQLPEFKVIQGLKDKLV